MLLVLRDFAQHIRDVDQDALIDIGAAGRHEREHHLMPRTVSSVFHTLYEVGVPQGVDISRECLRLLPRVLNGDGR